jgi:hypothetical protein
MTGTRILTNGPGSPNPDFEIVLLAMIVLPVILLRMHRSFVMRLIPTRNVIAAALGLVLLVGCQPGATTGQKPGTPPPPLPTDHQPSADEVVGSDECSNRMHNIEGALLMYYATNHRLPISLEEIKPFADAGTELKFTCPISNQPYVYSQAGLFASGYDKRIIVWDPAPSHHGNRWCIVMPQAQATGALVPEVVQMPEKAFQAFVPAIQ